MKKQLNEVKRLQKLAGILKENVNPEQEAETNPKKEAADDIYNEMVKEWGTRSGGSGDARYYSGESSIDTREIKDYLKSQGYTDDVDYKIESSNNYKFEVQFFRSKKQPSDEVKKKIQSLGGTFSFR